MATDALAQMQSALAVEVARRLFLIWQNPESRQFVRVGILSELVGGGYSFEYTDAARSAQGFYPLTQFPDLDRSYASAGLPAFFVNRLMSRKRDSFPEYLLSLGIDSPDLDTPMEILARTGGPRETDTFHLVDDMSVGRNGVVTSRFLASGVRHVAGSANRLACVAPGQRLMLRAQPDNPANKRAQLICVATGEPIAYVPDWLLDDIDNLRTRSDTFELIAERVSPDAHPHLRLLCRIEAHVNA